MQGAPVEQRRARLAQLISIAEGLAQEARDLGGEVWDFGEEMTDCERPIGALTFEAENLVSYLEDRKKALGL